MGLFKSFKSIVEIAQREKLDYVIVCEDDHVFLDNYDADILSRYISVGSKRRIEFDILLAGPSNFDDPIFANDDIFWVSKFTGLQFAVIFRRFFQTIINYDLEEDKDFDLELGKLSENIYCFYSSFSEQISFGYSDVTQKNNNIDVKEYFISSRKKMDVFYLLTQYYTSLMESDL